MEYLSEWLRMVTVMNGTNSPTFTVGLLVLRLRNLFLTGFHGDS